MRKKNIGKWQKIAVILLFASLGLTACGSKTDMKKVTDKSDHTSKTETTQEAVKDADKEGFTYADLGRIEFCFSSGAGAWSTRLTIAADGSFSGIYQDTDAGDVGDSYPNGTRYYCKFNGHFDDLQKVDDLTYKTGIQDISYDNEVGTQEIKDGILYVYTDVYGLEDAKDIYFYLPGTETDNLSEDLLSWIGSALYDTTTGTEQTKLSFVALYNENAGEGFASYDIVQAALDEIKSCEILDKTYTDQIETNGDMTQDQLNQTAEELYSLWDDCLNTVWDAIKLVKSDSEFTKIKEEQRAWIKDKEKQIQEAGEQYQGGSMRSMTESLKGAELTKKRVYELTEYLE